MCLVGVVSSRLKLESSLAEKIKKFFISDEKFSIENGMVTPTMKLKRYKIIQKYKLAKEY